MVLMTTTTTKTIVELGTDLRRANLEMSAASRDLGRMRTDCTSPAWLAADARVSAASARLAKASHAYMDATEAR